MVSWFHEGGRDETCHLLSKNNYIFIEKNFAFHTVAFPMQFYPSNNVKSCHMLPTTSFLNKNLFYSNAAHWSFWSWENSLFRGTCQPNSFKRGSGGVFTTWFLMLNSINWLFNQSLHDKRVLSIDLSADGSLVTGLSFYFIFGFDLLLTFNSSSSPSVYSARYISDQFLPDKAVDEAASALRLAQWKKLLC